MGYICERRKEGTGITGTINATWPGDLWKNGGAATWQGGTYDPDTNLSSPARAIRRRGTPYSPRRQLYSASRLAIDPDTGEIVWHYQTTPNDGWDYDESTNSSLQSGRQKLAGHRGSQRIFLRPGPHQR